MEALRGGDLRAFKTMLSEDSKVANVSRIGGSSPLMYAALYGNSDSVRLLLESGSDPNTRNTSGATPLMWAVGDLEKTRLLLDRGADANEKDPEGHPILMLAATNWAATALAR
jgi:ankyrin repeat protein